ncbi:alpha/beta hydrolase [Microbacterium elymi]|uniref:Alpha/beta hydrolase n=1 Tax=Microbacterium elymi TaxID=2909587 RepID=A0ABY5NLY1_9MICO|nr:MULTISPECIES: alpha/beta hydrolase [Microbacterium]UUT36200.1 alpha/beta hydrolase [Microbacterium elymi]
MTRGFTRAFTTVAAAAALVLTGGVAAQADATTTAPSSTHFTGTLADGATWVADKPADWNGVLVLYSHGFGTLSPSDAPNPDTQAALLDSGYALVGSSYSGPSLWALASATDDQFAALAAAKSVIGHPRQVLALGTSMGGLISAQEAERGNGRIDGALTTCGLLGGGVNLNNYQLDGEHAIAQLLADDPDIQLVDYADSGQVQAATAALTDAVTAGQQTAQGRARIALAAALMQTPDWISGDTPPTGYAEQQAQEAAWLPPQLSFVISGRPSIEASAGGNASWNVGVDYAKMIRRSDRYPQIRALYRTAGLNLDADLRTLTRTADIAPDADALRNLTATSTVTGKITVPELTLHTISDQLAPITYERQYRDQVNRAGRGHLLRQAYTQSIGHCNFTPAEIVGALNTVHARVSTGHWPSTTAHALTRAADVTGYGDSSFITYHPATFVNARTYPPRHHRPSWR